MSSKVTKTLVGVAAVIAIAVSAVWIYSITSGAGRYELPPQIAGQPVDLVDVETLEVVKVTTGDMQTIKRDPRGFIRNPKTGKFTLYDSVVCEACRQPTPFPVMPDGLNEKGLAAVLAWQKEQVCPRCKGCVYAEQVRVSVNP